jgi:DNA polymerase III delta prime subunit
MEQVIWTEKYRPVTVEGTVLSGPIKQAFEAYKEAKEIPNLILSGPAGVGKTTIAIATIEEIGADYIKINASLKRGIDMIRDELIQFASTVSFNEGRKYVILDEADGISSTAQEALKAFIEEYSANCFHYDTKIMTLEYGSKEIGSLLNKDVTIKAADGVWRKVKIKSYGNQELYKFKFGKFNSGLKNFHQEVIATKNHRWFLDNGFVTTNLSYGDKLKHISSNFLNDKGSLDGIIHGMIFGDGIGHKSYVQCGTVIPTQGKYASIRLCKQDKVQSEMFGYLVESGYEPNYPKSANGDPVFYLGYIPFVKDLPFTTDPDYIKGFIYGWWLADGKKDNRERFLISTIRKDAIDWLIEYASYAGLVVTGFNERPEGEGGFENGKVLYNVTLNPNYEPCVRDIEYYGNDEVFCLEEPVSTGFYLANGLMTGNCGFILTCNNSKKIIEPIKSRCKLIEIKPSKEDFTELGKKFYKSLCNILETEKVPYDKPTLLNVIKAFYPDWRQILIQLQDYSIHHKKVDSGILGVYSDTNTKTIIDLLKSKKWTELRKWVGENFNFLDDIHIIGRDIIKDAESLIDVKSLPELIILLNEYDYKNSFVMDKEVNLMAFLTQFMSVVVWK